MLRISPSEALPATLAAASSWPLFDTQATRRIEQGCARLLPTHTLMERAGLATARLVMALAPHARCIWIACGPGNNGGDGFEAAAQLKARLPHTRILVSEVREPEKLPADAQTSWHRARQAGVQWVDACPEDLGPQDLCIDALLGIGLKAGKASAADRRLPRLLEQTRQCLCTVLCIDIASGLDADTGQYPQALSPQIAAPAGPRHTIALLTLQPGLFTGQGRDACGQIWWDDLGCGLADGKAHASLPKPVAYLSTGNQAAPRPHASHKGSFGDVAVLGGEGLSRRGLSMTGAAWLAALAALHAGAGRVMLALLDAQLSGPQSISPWPEIMLRQPSAQDWSSATVVCGCGGGLAVADWLPQLLTQAPRLVLDADGLNAVAADPALARELAARSTRQQATVLTPHPLEAARLLQTSAAQIQSQRLQACLELAQKFRCTALLKGSGTVIANPQSQLWINSSGNARLATGGTGDVLAGLIGALWAQGLTAEQASVQAAFRHGLLAQQWPAERPFSASALAMQLGQ